MTDSGGRMAAAQSGCRHMSTTLHLVLRAGQLRGTHLTSGRELLSVPLPRAASSCCRVNRPLSRQMPTAPAAHLS
jgi:hypothetical protein